VIYCFDIDGTLCTNTEGDYESARPMAEAIARLNVLFDAKHKIILFTARGSTTGIDWRATTERQMKEWGVRYHELHLGKPTADIYIDDKAINIKDWLAAPAP
jgi:ribonucleotide monophosphatase NagD (HAD superfamily)